VKPKPLWAQKKKDDRVGGEIGTENRKNKDMQPRIGGTSLKRDQICGQVLLSRGANFIGDDNTTKSAEGRKARQEGVG